MEVFLVKQLTEVQKELLRQADNMAAAASSFTSHGYDSFINAREEFIDTIRHLDTDK